MRLLKTESLYDNDGELRRVYILGLEVNVRLPRSHNPRRDTSETRAIPLHNLYREPDRLHSFPS